MVALAFAHLNLTRNPFGQLAPSLLAELARNDAPQVVTGEALQIVAPKGSGKTTWLHAIEAANPGCVRAAVDLHSSLASPAPRDGAVYLLDEADFCKLAQLRGIARSARTVVLATHSDLSPRVPRPLRTVRTPPLTTDRLHSIVERRVECCRRAPGPTPMPSMARLAALLEEHGDDLRSILDRLYDALQGLQGDEDGSL